MPRDVAAPALVADVNLELCTIEAARFGAAMESWLVFLAALAIAVAGGVYAGNIRPRPSRR